MKNVCRDSVRRRIDHARRGGVEANAARTEDGCPVLDECFNCTFGGSIRENRWIFQAGSAHCCVGYDRRNNGDIRSLTQERQELLHQKERTSGIGREEVVKILNGVIDDERCLADSGIEHEYVKVVSDDGADLICEQRCTVSGGKIYGYCICTAAMVPDRRDERLCLLGRSSIVDQDVCAGFGERQRRSAANSPRCAVTSAVLLWSVFMPLSPLRILVRRSEEIDSTGLCGGSGRSSSAS